MFLKERVPVPNSDIGVGLNKAFELNRSVKYKQSKQYYLSITNYIVSVYNTISFIKSLVTEAYQCTSHPERKYTSAQ